MTVAQIPRFGTEQEMREFWHTHDSAEYFEDMTDDEVSVEFKRDKGVLAIPLAEERARSVEERVMPDGGSRSYDLRGLASKHAKAGEPYKHIFEEALEVAKGIGDEEERVFALRKIASELASTGEPFMHVFGEAMKVATYDLREIASRFAKAGKFEKALEAARSIGDGRFRSDRSDRSDALKEVASELAKAGELYKHVFGEALEAARSMNNEEVRESALSDIADELVNAGAFEEALEVVKSTYVEEESIILGEIAQGLAKVGEFEKALETARGVDDKEDRSDALKKLHLNL